MRRKATVLAVLTVFIIFSGGCMTWGPRSIRATARPPKQGARIIGLIKTSGATVLFSASDPGRIVGNAVVGTARGGAWEQVEIRKPVPLVRKDEAGRVYEIVDRDGRTYPVGSILSEDADRIVIFIVGARVVPVSVPLSEIASVRIKKFDLVRTTLALAGLTAAGYLGAFLIMYRGD